MPITLSRPYSLLPLFLLLLSLLKGCAGQSQPLGLTPGGGQYHDLAEAWLGGEEVDVGQLREAWLGLPDVTTRSDILARSAQQGDDNLEARLKAYAVDLTALRAGVGSESDPLQTERLLERAFDAVLASGDGTPEAPWQVTSRGDAIAVLELLDLEVVGGYYHLADAHPLTLRLRARPYSGAPSREWAFDLSDVFWAHHRNMAQHRPGMLYSPLVRMQELARLGDHDAVTSTALLMLESDPVGSRQTAATRLFEAASVGNQVADALLGDQFWALAEERDGEERARALAEAERAYRRAAQSGYDYGSYRLGYLQVLQGDSATGLALLDAAAAEDNADALRMLAALHRDGRHIAQDPLRARDYYRRLHALGDVAGRYDYANWALLENAAEDSVAAAALLANVADGDARSIGLKGDLHAVGRYFSRDHDRAQELWRQAARNPAGLGHAHDLARSLTHNPESLQDPAFAAALLEHWLLERSPSEACAVCYVTWVEALLASDQRREASAALELALRRVDAQSEASARSRLLALAETLDDERPRQDMAARSGQRTPVPPRPQ